MSEIKKIPPLTPAERAEIIAKASAEDPTWAHCGECGCSLKKSDTKCRYGDNYAFCPAFRKT